MVSVLQHQLSEISNRLVVAWRLTRMPSLFRQIFSALFLIGTLWHTQSAHCQTTWISIPKEEINNWVGSYSLKQLPFRYQMPSSKPSALRYHDHFKIHDLYVRSDGGRFKVTLSYCDLSTVDTSDIKNYIPARVINIDRSEKTMHDVNQLAIWQAGVPLDTSSKTHLWKKQGDDYVVFRYLYEPLNKAPFKIYRVSGDIQGHLAKKTPANFGLVTWHGEEPIYKEDPLRYIKAGDSIVVYGQLDEPTGIYARNAILHFDSNYFCTYDNLAQAIVVPVGEKYEEGYWLVRNYRGRIYSETRALCKYIFKNVPDSLPKLSCFDNRISPKWHKVSDRSYYIQIEIPPGVEDLVFTIQVKTKESEPTNLKCRLTPLN